MSLPLHWTSYMDSLRARAATPPALHRRGTLQRLTGLALEAEGLRAPVGSQCVVRMEGMDPLSAEVVGFSGERTYLMPAGSLLGMASGASLGIGGAGATGGNDPVSVARSAIAGIMLSIDTAKSRSRAGRRPSAPAAIQNRVPSRDPSQIRLVWNGGLCR